MNPWNTDELAQAIYDALVMPEDLRKANQQKLFRYVTKYTAAHWGLCFVSELKVALPLLSHVLHLIQSFTYSLSLSWTLVM